MKISHLLAAVCVISTLGTGSVRAEPGKIEKTIDLLHQAETAADPLPLLEKAKEELKNFNPRPNQEALIAGKHVGPRKVAGVDLGATKHKKEAMEALDEAIAAAKSGAGKPVAPNSTTLGSSMDAPVGDFKSKVENVIAKVHMAGEAKH